MTDQKYILLNKYRGEKNRCDYSGRYAEEKDLDGDNATITKPWAAPPVDGIFAIPFQYFQGTPVEDFVIYAHSNKNVNRQRASDQSISSHQLKFNDQVLTKVYMANEELNKWLA